MGKQVYNLLIKDLMTDKYQHIIFCKSSPNLRKQETVE